jgi:transcriptional regulator with GAF, ATPase, and Fis domain
MICRARVTQPACGTEGRCALRTRRLKPLGVAPAAGTEDVRCDLPETPVTRPEPDDVVIRSAFEDLGRIVLADHSLDSLLQRVTDAAARIVPGRPMASVTVVRRGRFATVAASHPVAAELDAVQYDRGGGPCTQAAVSGRPVAISDMRTDPRWSGFTSAAAARGVLSVLSHPLPVQERVRAGLNLYADAPRAGDERTDRLVTRLAGYAVVPVSNLYLYRTAVEQAENLEAALDSRAVIDQAKGILMERFKLSADQAFQALARLCMERNVRLREVADRLVRTGELPGR